MFKDKLKQLREKEGLTQQQLANQIFVSRSAVAKWENGLGIPSEESLKLLCDHFEIAKEKLLDEHDVIITCQNIEQKTKYDITIMKILLFTIIFIVLFVILYNTFINSNESKYKPIYTSKYYDTENIIHDINEKYVIDINNINSRVSINYDKIDFWSTNSDVLIEKNIITFNKLGKYDIYGAFYNNQEKQIFEMIILTVYCYDSNETMLINSVDDLNNINNNLTGSYILNCDINFKDVNNFIPIKGTFKGVFINPNNYVIRNLNVIIDNINDTLYLGLFENISNAYINNIILEDIKFIANVNDEKVCTFVGGICGSASDSHIENCKVIGKVKGQNYVGGLIGMSDESKIKNCTFIGEVIEESNINKDCFVGGIIGYSSFNNEITNNVVNAKISSTSYGGGVVGYAYFNHSLYSVIEDNDVYVLIEAKYSDKIGCKGKR